jgi:hypothetical protein
MCQISPPHGNPTSQTFARRHPSFRSGGITPSRIGDARRRPATRHQSGEDLCHDGRVQHGGAWRDQPGRHAGHAGIHHGSRQRSGRHLPVSQGRRGLGGASRRVDALRAPWDHRSAHRQLDARLWRDIRQHNHRPRTGIRPQGGRGAGQPGAHRESFMGRHQPWK